MVLIEALQAGLPSVSFDINAGPDELICDGVNGYLVPAFDVVMYAEKLCELIDSAERRKIFSKCSHRELYKMERNKIINCWIENIICKD